MKRRILGIFTGALIVIALTLAAGCGGSGSSSSLPASGGDTTSGNVSGSAE